MFYLLGSIFPYSIIFSICIYCMFFPLSFIISTLFFSSLSFFLFSLSFHSSPLLLYHYCAPLCLSLFFLLFLPSPLSFTLPLVSSLNFFLSFFFFSIFNVSSCYTLKCLQFTCKFTSLNCTNTLLISLMIFQRMHSGKLCYTNTFIMDATFFRPLHQFTIRNKLQLNCE